MNKTITLILLLISLQSIGQKKLIPVTQSEITGIMLPAGSKQDNRMLMSMAGKALLEIETKKSNITIEKTELLTLPNATAGSSADSLIEQLTGLGWTITPVQNDEKYFWLQKGNRSVIGYFSIDKKENSLYFGETTAAPQAETNNTQNSTVNPVQQNPEQPVVQQPVQTMQENSTTGNTIQTAEQNNTITPYNQPAFTFTTTNFDDGWTSVVKEDWVEVMKGNIKILLHYPNKIADAYNSVFKESDYTAWNTLVAPHYNNMKNFEWKTIQSYESISFIEADATENASGKTVHIVLFKKHYSNGNGRYLEFITENKADYENEFGAYHTESYGWEKPAAMQYRNKFSVAANDLIGKWTTSDYASVSYYYVNTGGLASTSSTATADEFTFLPENNYQSQHSGASGMVGNMKFSNQEYKGKSAVTNWNLVLTNRFQGATEKYDCYFEAIKGGRILLMTDRLGTTHALVKKQ